MNIGKNEDATLEVEIRGQRLRLTPEVLDEIRDFIGDEGAQMAERMNQAINGTAREIVNRAERRTPIGAWFTGTKTSCEEIGMAVAGACVTFLGTNIPQWVEQTERELAEFTGDTVVTPQSHNKFQLELSALVFVSFRIAISLFGPNNASKRSRIYEAFDRATHQALANEFFDVAHRRVEYYFDCVRDNWREEFLGLRLTTIFNHFVLGGENFGREPLRGCDVFEFHARGTTALAAVGAAFDVCHLMFQRTRVT